MAIVIGDILLRTGYITKEQLARALATQREEGGRIGEVLIRQGALTEQQILEALSRQFGIPLAAHDDIAIHESLIGLIPIHVIQRFNILPLKLDSKELTVVISDPTKIYDLKEIKLFTGFQIKPLLASESSIRKVIERYTEEQPAPTDMKSLLSEVESTGQNGLEVVDEEDREDAASLEADAKQPPVVKIVNHSLMEAVRLRASDIHIEPFEDHMRIRLRVDGLLRELIRVPAKYKDGVAARIKVLAKMDISERRLPQDGRIKIQIKADGRLKGIDIRVSMTPALFGQKVVMRLLDKEGLMLDMSKLGFEPDSLRVFDEALFKPWGMILVTGPTGSGKTNTLYSAIGRINTPEVNIMTAEDPIEFNLQGINQVQVQEGIGLTFASVLRSFLRQDPNVILVGEIRDNETAEIATKASLTGHLVLSTLHTNDAPSTVSRLVDMGIDPYLVATSVILICAQRLVRRICQHCKEEVQIPPKALINIGFTAEEAKTVKIFKGLGCGNCNGTGYKGRIGLYEVMPMTTPLRDLIFAGANATELRKQAVADGMITLRRSGLMKIASGTTSIEEVMRETF
jgi:type IV pilus assembly protein PilB